MLGATNKEHGVVVFCGFSAGCFISFILNHIVHSYTSQSLIHCAHSNSEDDLHPEYEERRLSEQHTDGHSHSQESAAAAAAAAVSAHALAGGSHTEQDSADLSSSSRQTEQGSHSHAPTEIDPLICSTIRPKPSSSISEYQTIECIPIARHATMSSLPLTKCLTEQKSPAVCIETNIGYDLENLAVYRDQFMMKGDTSLDSSSDGNAVMHESDHKHVMETPFSKLLSIGIQTCLVICLHKFPEGFIIFYTNSPDQINDGNADIGFSIFLSLAIHNFIEGFAMTLPLFTALETKWHALIITTVLGGGSQPLGAFLGLEWYKHTKSDHSPEYLEAKMDFLLSITAGFLFVISLQMFQTAVAFSDTHHHHEGEDDVAIKEQHSSGITCLKFCCVGVLLILGSSALQALS